MNSSLTWLHLVTFGNISHDNQRFAVVDGDQSGFFFTENVIDEKVILVNLKFSSFNGLVNMLHALLSQMEWQIFIDQLAL